MTCLRTLVFCLLALGLGSPGYALPSFAQRYKVECSVCHTAVPRLNAFGAAFKANFYRWPEQPSVRGTVPLAYQQSERRETLQSLTGTRQSTQGELFLAESFSLHEGKFGAIFAQLYTQTNGEIPRKALGEAYLLLPLLGNHRALALTVGQASALPQQYEPQTRLTQSQPGALAASAGGFSFTEPRPLVRLDWFGNRGRGTANGDYLSLAMPFNSALTLTSESEVGTGFGLSLHAFRRWNTKSIGIFGYENGSDNRLGVLATRELGPTLSLLAAASTGHDLGATTPKATLETTWLATPQLALTGRWEQAPHAAYPVLGLTALLPKFPGLRLGLEAVLHPGQRETSLTTHLAL